MSAAPKSGTPPGSRNAAPPPAATGEGARSTEERSSEEKNTATRPAPQIHRWGATAEEWQRWTSLASADLLPTVCDPNVLPHPRSSLKTPGKVPSRYGSFDGKPRFVGFPGWTTHFTKKNEIESWSQEPNYGICLQTRRYHAIDIDVEDPAFAQRVEEIARMTLGNLPVRSRANSARRLMLVRTGTDFVKRVVCTAHGNIEILGTGQQCVVAGTHPSGARYEWHAGSPEDVPLVDRALLEEFIQTLDLTFGASRTGHVTASVPRSESAVRPQANEAWNPEPPLGRSLDALRATLDAVDPDLPYDDWMRCLAAVHHETSGSEEGFLVVDSWSARGSKYRGPDDVRSHWRSFSTTRAAIVGARWLESFARRSTPPTQTPVVRAPLDWAQLDQQEPPPREWIIPLWLPAGHVTLVVGKAGVGKTLLTQCIGTAVSQGHDYLECIRPRRVLFWAGEDDEAKLWRRQVAICGAFDPIAVDRPLASLAGRLFAYSYAGADITLATPVQGVLRPTPMLETLRGHVRDHGAELVILDNVARLFGGNENDRHQVTVFISLVQAACAPAAVLLIGHPSKIAGSEYSGSTAWEGAVRTRLYFGDRPPDVADTEDAAGDNVRYLARRKSNYSALDLRRFTLVGGALLPDAVEPATAVTDVVARDLVLRAVGQLAAAGQHMSASVASPGYLPKLARQYQLLGSLGERAFASTMRKMLLDGSLVTREVGKYANRAPRMGVALP